MSEANAKAEKLVKDARAKSQSIVDSYQSQIAEKEKELEMMKREVTAFRASLYEIYRSHIAVIEKIPEYDFDDEDTETAAPAPAAPKATYAPQPVEEPEEEEEIPCSRGGCPGRAGRRACAGAGQGGARAGC